MQDVYTAEPGVYVADLAGDDHRIQVVQKPFDTDAMGEGVVMDLLDESGELQRIRGQDTVPGRPVFAIMPTSGLLLWRTLLSLLESGFTPAEVMDLVALGFEIYADVDYALSRGVPEEELRANVEETIDEMLASAAP
ncbi:hypothetical protein [Halobacterium sp. R2-5]|uniref:hypothetical protein n=1 Tax=Halobacterium sp. R2-5 TaxID=2715751 RepID=UPI00141F8E76|nr:hypothetical protein [Halobacterium sp. R2-5]NIC01033.1 hypothetical protein [Halobacterium sp. R2-5]